MADDGLRITSGDLSVSATSPSIIEGIRRADPIAWERLAELWTPLIFGRCRRQGLSEEDAEDVTQNVLVRIYSGLTHFQRDGVHNRFRCWVATITRNQLADFHNARIKSVRAAGGSDARQQFENIAAPLDESDEQWCGPAVLVAQALQAVQRDVSPQTWEAFCLVNYQHLSVREAAERLQMKDGAVRAATQRVRDRLRADLRGMLH